MNWKRFTRRDACPVCNGDRPDCRQSLETSLVYCRSLDANPLDYVHRGQDTWGFNMWAYKPDTDQWTDERRSEWERERELRKSQRERDSLESLKNLLPIKERDLVIHLILGQLTLCDRHREILKARGLSDRQIDLSGYRSVAKWQKLDKPVDNRLSGVNQQGNKLNNNTDGILIPVPNENGLYTALRVNNLDSATNELGKYLWVSSKNSRGIPIDLPNGNLPIAVYYPKFEDLDDLGDKEDKENKEASPSPVSPPSSPSLQKQPNKPPEKQIIGFTEGLEYKPLLAANKLGIPIIGASGGNFGSSKEAVEKAIATIKEKYGINDPEFVLYADAGSVINPNVVGQYQKLGELVPNLKIADWGQLSDKEKGLDIDEIDSETIEKIKLISIGKFSEKAKFEQRKQPYIPDIRIKRIQEKLRKFSYQVDIELTEKDLIDGKYLPCETLVNLMSKQGIINLIAPKGSGKSHLIKEFIDTKKQEGYSIISIVPRIALGRGQAKDWGIDWEINIDEELIKRVGLLSLYENYQEMGSSLNSVKTIPEKKITRLTFYETQKTLGLCFDSIWKVAQRKPEKTLIILDEAELGLTHLLSSSTCKDSRPKLLKAFKDLIFNCLNNQGIVLLSDADLSDISTDFIKSLSPKDTPVFSIVNKTILPGYKAFIFKQKKWVNQEILNSIEAGERIIIATCSQKEAEKKERELMKRYPGRKVVRIDAKTTQQDWGKDFIERINESIKKEQPDILIYSPSMGTGTSIDGKIDGIVDKEIQFYFDKVFGIFNGTLTPSQCRQMLMRFRALVPRYIFIKPVGNVRGNGSFDPKDIRKTLHEYHNEGLGVADILGTIKAEDPQDLIDKLQAMVNPNTRDWDNPFIDSYSKFKARDNYGLSHLRELFIDELAIEGNEVIVIDLEDRIIEPKTSAFIKGEKEQSEAIDKEESYRISQALDIPLEQAKAITRSATATLNERDQAAKAFLKEELPEVELSPEFIYTNIVKDKRRSLNALKLFWKLNNIEEAKYSDIKEYSHKFRQFASFETVYTPDIKAYYPLIQEAINSGIKEFIDTILANPDQEYLSDSPELLALKQRLLFRRSRLKDFLGVVITIESDPIHLANRILGKFGLLLKGEQKRIEGERVRVYRLDTERLNHPDRLAILTALDLKWAKTQANQPLEGVTRLENFSYITKNESPVTPLNTIEDTMNTNIIHPIPGIEDTPPGEIASFLALIDNVDVLRWLVVESGLSKSQRQKAWELLPSEQKRRLIPIFEELKKTG